MKVPTLSKRVVCHVGDLSKKTRERATGWEFTGLSVSEHPEEWEEIAKLGGSKFYALGRSDGKSGRFVDFYEIDKRPFVATALQRGWLREGHAWRLEYFDSEEDAYRHSFFPTKREAEAEAEDDESARVSRVDVLLPTALLRQVWVAEFPRQRRDLDALLAEEFAIYLLLEEVGAYDGVWWTEELDPAGLSAPRGSIFQSKLGRWSATEIPRGACP